MTTKRKSKRRQRPRGFALLVVLLIGVACLVGAYGVTASAARSGQSTSHTVDRNIADSLAKAGLGRAETYAMTTSGSGDFDFVLDPDANVAAGADCQNLASAGTVTAGANTYMPLFADGATQNYNGNNWRRVSIAGGAYLVRFEDDGDDGYADGQPMDAADMGNNVNGTKACDEGPVLLDGVENPVRDRNRSIWVYSVGIYPGTNPATARHVSAKRKLLIQPTASLSFDQQPLMTHEKVDVSGGVFEAIGAKAGVWAKQIHETGGENAICGSAIADTGSIHAGVDEPGGGCGANPLAKMPQSSSPPFAQPALTDAVRMDFTSHCNFWFDESDPETLMFWDAAGSRGGINCSAPGVGTIPAPTGVTTQPGSCWVPLFLAYSATASDPCGLGEVDVATYASEARWKPGAWSAGPTVTTSCGTHYTGANAPVTINQPDWGLCPTTSFDWPPGSGTPVKTCTDASYGAKCDGSVEVIQWTHSGSDDEVKFLNAPTAYPVGLYITPNDWKVEPQSLGPAPPLAQDQTTGYAMITLMVYGTFDIESTAYFSVGVGIPGNGTVEFTYPSMIVGGELKTHDSTYLRAAGSVYALKSGGHALHVTDNSNMDVFGVVLSNHDIKVDGSSPHGLKNEYLVDMFTPTTTGSAIPPSVPPHLSLPLSF